jgi:hypothetical protein
VSAWATPPETDAGPRAARQGVSGRRALPVETRHRAGPDAGLLLAALVAVGAAFVAWRAIAEPWVRLVITDTTDRRNPTLVGEVTLRGDAAMIGLVAQALTVALAAYGLAWVLYGFDRRSTMPWFVNPATPIVSSIAGLIVTAVAAIVWFVWEDAAVAHARSAGLSGRTLRDLLDTRPAPLVEVHQLPGLTNFGLAMLAGLLAASVAWWASHKRG